MKKTIIFLLFTVSPSLLFAKDLVFIVNAKLEKKVASKSELKDIFIKKKQYWPGGKKIRPIEQDLGSSARKSFLKNVLQKSEIEMSEYWIEQKQMNGLVQPIQLESDQLVIQLVRSMPGSIGYIESEVKDQEGITVLEGVD